MNCNVCGVGCSMTCSHCKLVPYCCQEHQRADWLQHKGLCTLDKRYRDKIRYVLSIASDMASNQYLYIASMCLYLEHGRGAIMINSGNKEADFLLMNSDAISDYNKYTVVTEDTYVEYANYRVDHRLQYNPMTTFIFGMIVCGHVVRRYITLNVKELDDEIIVSSMLSKMTPQYKHKGIHTTAKIFHLFVGIFRYHIDNQVRISYANYRQHHRGCIYYVVEKPSDLISLDYYPLTFIEDDTAAIKIRCGSLLCSSDVL